MRFAYDKEMTAKMIEGLRNRKGRFDEELKLAPSLQKMHISALTKCLKRAYFKAKGARLEFDQDRLLRFAIGRSHHEVLQNFGITEAEIDGEGDLAGIVCHIDILDEYPIEIKSTRMRITGQTTIPDHYVKQLGYSCVLARKNMGYLAILWIISPDLSVYKVEFESDELSVLRNELIMKRDLLRKAFEEPDEKKALESLPKGEFWECTGCECVVQCKSQR